MVGSNAVVETDDWRRQTDHARIYVVMCFCQHEYVWRVALRSVSDLIVIKFFFFFFFTSITHAHASV